MMMKKLLKVIDDNCSDDLVYIALNLPYLSEERYNSVNFKAKRQKELFNSIWNQVHHLYHSFQTHAKKIFLIRKIQKMLKDTIKD